MSTSICLQVGRMVVDHLLERLSDYHANFPSGSEQGLQVGGGKEGEGQQA